MRLAAAVLGALLLVSACSTSKDAVEAGTDFVFVSPGGKTDITYDGADRKPMPNLTGPSLSDDAQISVAAYRGKVVVLNIWGQWCGPCRLETPELQKVQDKYAASTQIIGIDVRDNERQAPQDFLRDRSITYPSIYDPPGKTLLALKGYPRAVVPATFVLDKQGRVAAAFMRDLLATDLIPLIDRLTAE